MITGVAPLISLCRLSPDRGALNLFRQAPMVTQKIQ